MIRIVNNNIYIPRGESETAAWEMTFKGAPYVNTYNWLSGRVSEYADEASLPVTGTAGIYYLTLDTDIVYEWDGASYVIVEDITTILPTLTLTLPISKNIYSSKRNVKTLSLELSYDNFLYKIFNSQFVPTNIIESDSPVWDSDLYSLRTLYKAVSLDGLNYEYGYFVVTGLDEITLEPVYEWVAYDTPVITLHIPTEATLNLDAQTYLYELYYDDGVEKRTLLKPHNFVVEATSYGR